MRQQWWLDGDAAPADAIVGRQAFSNMVVGGLEEMGIDSPRLGARERAFVDTNVLAHIVGDTKTGQAVFTTLRNADFDIVTFAKCVYELYSIVKGTTRGGQNKGKHPLKKLVPPEINDIAQRLFKTSPDIDPAGSAYYWYNLCEEWQGWDYFGSAQENIEMFLEQSLRPEAHILLEKQKEFVKWKMGVKAVFRQIDSLIKEKGILVCQYFQVFSSDWYNKKGFFYEQALAQDSLLPNEDFEIVLAALFLGARVFVTEDDKGLIWRGGLSLGLNTPPLVFCCPERLDEAIKSNFEFRFYRKK